MLPCAPRQPPHAPAQEATLPFGVGPLEIVVLLVILLIAAGPAALPKVSRSLGSGVREVRDAVTFAPREQRRPPDRAPSDDADPPA